MEVRISLLCLLVSGLSIGQGAVFTPAQETMLQEFTEHLMQCREITGLTLAVVKDNETWTRGFGMADKESGRNVTSSTLFGIGSVTKAFTSAILSLFINETGRYSWETTIAEILGEDFRFSNDELTRHVTLKDLLTHRTGLQASAIPLYADTPDGLTREEFAKRMRYLPEAAPFRDEWSYNNWMYGLLGRVAEVMGGASYEDLLRTRLFQPLGMTDSRVLGQTVTVEADNFAKPYVMVGGDVVPSDPTVYRIYPQEAAGAIASSADDMAKWLLLHLNKGQTLGGAVVLNDTRVREMSEASMGLPASEMGRIWQPAFPVTYVTFSYGYGWFVAAYRGYSVKWHSGGFFAYVTYLALIPDLNLGVFVSTNGPGNGNASHIIRQLFYYVTDLQMGLDPWLNLNNACDFPEPWLNSTSGEPKNDTVIVDDEKGFDNAGHFAGTYGHLLFGDIEVRVNGSNGLNATFIRLRGRLYRTEDENVAMLAVAGPMAFLSQGVNSTNYIQFNFSEPSSDGKYQRLEVSSPDLGEVDVLIFKRGVRFSDPGTDSASRVPGIGVLHLICLLVFVLHVYSGAS